MHHLIPQRQHGRDRSSNHWPSANMEMLNSSQHYYICPDSPLPPFSSIWHVSHCNSQENDIVLGMIAPVCTDCLAFGCVYYWYSRHQGHRQRRHLYDEILSPNAIRGRSEAPLFCFQKRANRIVTVNICRVVGTMNASTYSQHKFLPTWPIT